MRIAVLALTVIGVAASEIDLKIVPASLRDGAGCLPDGARCDQGPPFELCCGRGQCNRHGVCETFPAMFDVIFTDCGNQASGGWAAAKLDRCFWDSRVVGQQMKISCEGHQKPPYTSVDAAKFDINITSDVGATLLACSGDAARSKTCKSESPQAVSDLTFHAMEFPLGHDLSVTFDISFEQIMATTTVAKVTGEESKELLCIKMLTVDPTKCLPDGIPCGGSDPAFCCNECKGWPRGVCSPIMIQKGNSSVAMPQQETSVIAV